jgi:hypothetical protein
MHAPPLTPSQVSIQDACAAITCAELSRRGCLVLSAHALPNGHRVRVLIPAAPIASSRSAAASMSAPIWAGSGCSISAPLRHALYRLKRITSGPTPALSPAADSAFCLCGFMARAGSG